MSGLEMSEAGMYQCFCYNTIQISQTYMPVSVKSKFPFAYRTSSQFSLVRHKSSLLAALLLLVHSLNG